jgi:hypothetical protein
LDRAGKPFFPQEEGYSVVGAAGRAPDTPASFCGNKIGSPAAVFLPPMLFPRNTLPSGPQACFSPEKNRTEVKGGKGEFIIDENFKN